METWLQIISGLSQKGHREFKYGHTGTGYLHSYVKKRRYMVEKLNTQNVG